MMYQLTMQDVTYQGYSIQYPPAVSSRVVEMDISEMVDSLLAIWMKKKRLKEPFFYRTLLALLETDSSSVWPRFETKSETSLIKEAVEEAIPEEILEFNIVVRMPPIKEWTTQVRIKSTEKATPHIVEPGGI